jgi:hypothetical protein
VILRWFSLVLRASRYRGAVPGDRRLCWAFAVSMAALMTIFMTVPIMVHRHYWLLFGLGIAAAGFVSRAAKERRDAGVVASIGGSR